MFCLRFRHHLDKRWDTTSNSVQDVYYYWDISNQIVNSSPSPTLDFDSTFYDFEGFYSGVEDVSFTIEKESLFSTTITVYGDLYQYIHNHLFKDPSGRFKSIDVEVWDCKCGTKLYDCIIRSYNIKVCEDECSMELTLNEVDLLLECFKSNNIADNWQGWFQNDTTKQHPVFGYCNVPTPDFVRIALMLFASSLAFLILTLYPIIWLISQVVNVIVWVVNGLGGNIDCDDPPNGNDTGPLGSDPCIEIPSPGTLNQNIFEILFGCDRQHPAPFVRTYIENMCGLCSEITGKTLTFDNNYAWDNGFGDIYNDPNSPYYNACYYSPVFARGWDSDDTPENTYHWDGDNNPNKNMYDFLNELAPVHNAEWYFEKVGATYNLKFINKTSYENVVFDLFSDTDRVYVVDNLCCEWYEKKNVSYLEFKYSVDSIDTIGNGAKQRYNGIASYGTNYSNAVLQGNETINVKFGALRVYDDWIEYPPYDPDQNIFLAVILNIIGAGYGFAQLQAFSDAQAGKIIQSTDYNELPKLVIWDETSPLIVAKVKNYYWYNTNLIPYNPPIPYTNQNPNSLDYSVANELKAPRYHLYNYPYFFDPKFNNNLYQYFFEREYDIFYNKKYFRECKFSIKNCCEIIERLRVGALVKIPTYHTQVNIGAGVPQFAYGRIKNLSVTPQKIEVTIVY